MAVTLYMPILHKLRSFSCILIDFNFGWLLCRVGEFKTKADVVNYFQNILSWILHTADSHLNHFLCVCRKKLYLWCTGRHCTAVNQVW
jgi:hypothetical protein